MEVLIVIFLIFLLISVLLLALRLLKWILRDKMRSQLFCVLLVIGFVGVGGHHFFLKNMLFIQSEVYPDLYLIKYPENDQSVLHQAIQDTVKHHFSKRGAAGKKLAYENENAIFFYEYYKAFPLSVFQDEGTAYFLDNEEDLGGLVTEEIGMYTQYKLAEFAYVRCKDEVTLYCGELRFFNENGVVKSVGISNITTLIEAVVQ
ncbi:hypothetical protein [Sneathiella aquimaris]|uniref:hypothetical protein n=1 Tax=Sneathiella aquimaris TaxID=2599305 RepID=UPI00146D6510|nr:hypothetical protein [Sneathiella aquimaris]